MRRKTMATFCVSQEGPVNALALNRDNTQVAVGGRNVFKVYLIEEDGFKEVYNLRTAKHLNFSCNDVSWSALDDHYLATAATNGHVCVWNLTKMGKAMQEQNYQDHKRTVNKVNFHASEPNKLISGSQDGTMRYFDIRVRSAVSIFYSNTESVRDVQFSPHNPYAFAAVSDNGSVQLWDVRKTDKCQQAYSAHSGPVFACDWHPETSWLATASRDKSIKVWDLTSKPTLEYTIHTIASIGHVKWRPQRKYHIASCALVIDCSINIWDVRRPYIPFASFNEHRDIASGVVWRGDPHTFLSSGRDFMLYQHNFNDANRPASKANPQGMVLNRKGEVLYAQKLNVVSPVNTSNSALAKATVGLMRKISNTQPIDQFHQATSLLHFFSNVSQLGRQSDSFVILAENYILNGPSISEMCDHNANIALECGKSHIATVWKLVKIIYGEETMMRGYVLSGNNNRDDISLNIHPLSTAPPSPVPPSVEFKDEDYEQRSRVTTDGETPAAQFSGGDDETENEDQVDAMIYNNAFPTYLNYRSGLPKGDFTFGEIELDTDMDGLIMSDFPNGLSYPDIESQKMKEDDFILPHEGFPLRHEIRDHSPPVDHFPDRSSPVIKEEQAIAFQPLDEEQDLKPGRVSVSHPLRKPVWDPGNIVVEALKHHAELGDIQTTASVLIVIGDCRKSLKLSDARQEYWLLGYIELLTQYKLFNVASKVIKLSWIPSVLQLSQMSTRINTNCSKCSKPLQRIGWLCDRCHSQKYGLCIVCHQVVKGLYAWCQGCSHGGHINHIKEWLAKRKTCPSGCGHSCLYNFGQNWQMNMRQPSTHLLK